MNSSCRFLLIAGGIAFSMAFGQLAVAASPADDTQAAKAPSYTSLNTLPDWSGIWTLKFPPPVPKPAPMKRKGKYLQALTVWEAQLKARDGQVARATSNCLPPGMPALMTLGQYPIEFLFTPGRVTIHHEAWMQWRTIHTDNRKQPEDLDPTFQGSSIGHWEGTTLVIETIGVKEDLPLTLGTMGVVPAHGPKLRILERIHLDVKDPDSLIDEMTLEDPDALEEPWKQTLAFQRSRDQELLEFVCAENDRNPVDASGKTEFIHK